MARNHSSSPPTPTGSLLPVQLGLDTFLKLFSNRRIGAVTVLGFASGLPLALTSGTLQAWMTVTGVDLATIGFFSLVGLPYILKPLWAPIMDRYVPPLFGRRRGWLLITQLLLVLGLAAMAYTSPIEATRLLALLALLVAFASASQDIAYDAYRTDILHASERGLGAALSVGAYRLAMLSSGALALVLASALGWQNTYLIMAALMGVGILGSLLGPEPEQRVQAPHSLAQAIINPLKEFVTRRGALNALLILLLILFYKLGDAFAGALNTTFLIRGPGFDLEDIAVVSKGMGVLATILGAVYGGVLLARMGLFRALLVFGLLQAVTNLGFMWLALAGKQYAGLVLVIGAENLVGGMGTAAFVALLMALCDHRYTAFQFALLSAFASFGRVFLSSPSGLLAKAFDWPVFFLFSFLIALPGIVLLWIMRREVQALDTDNPPP